MNASVTSISKAKDSQATSERLQRVVLQYGDHALRGFADRSAWANSGAGEGFPPEALWFRPLDSETLEEVSFAGIKAIFFVKRFDGPGLDEMRFHDRQKPMERLWVRVVFQDGEIMEGLLENRADFVLQPGFFLKPTDPEANHSLIYVAKAQVCEFQVLGLRAAVKG